MCQFSLIHWHKAGRALQVLTGHNRPKYFKRDIAFRGLLNCAHDGCMLTGEVQKRSTSTTAALATAANAICRASRKKSYQSEWESL